MPVRAADLETRLYATDREFNRTLDQGERRAGRFAENVSRSFRSASGGLSARGGLLPGLAQLSEVIQGIPQIGRLAGALLDPLKDATEEGVRFNMMVESAEVGFRGVAGSIEDARKHVAALRQFGEDSPLFDSSGLIRTSRLMNVFGFELSEHIPKIKIWGDAIASSGEMSEETLLGVARAFGQIKSLGRVNAEEMNQLAERGIPAWELLAKAIGKTVAETRRLGEQGRLRGGAAVEAITAQIAEDPRFKGTAEGLAGTLQGRLARVGEIRERAQGIATEGLTKDISDALAGALTREDLAVSMAGTINTAIAPVSGLIKGAIVTTIGGGISGGFTDAVNAAKSVLPAQMMSLGTDGIINPLKTVLGIQSPSKVTYQMGLDLAEGFHQGLAAGLSARPFSDEIERAIAEAARVTGLDPSLIRAVIRQESGGRKDAVSSMGAKGLMQLMPGTARQLGVTNPFDVQQNVMGGSKYLAELLAEFKDLRLALAAYNAGPGAVRAFLPNRPDVNSYVGGSGRRFTVSEEKAQRAQGIPQNDQTPGYVRSIMGMFEGGIRQPLPETGLSPRDPLAGLREERQKIIEDADRKHQSLMNKHLHLERVLSEGMGEYGGRGRFVMGDERAMIQQALAETAPALRRLADEEIAALKRVDAQIAALQARVASSQDNFHDVPAGSGLDDTPFPLAGSSGLGASMLQPSKAVSDLTPALRDAREVQFELLRLMGDTGPVAGQGFGQAKEAVRDWYAEVVGGAEAATFLGISGKDAALAFEDAWVGSMTRVDEGLSQMLRNIPLTFAQSLNQMAQQWAASQLSGALSKLIGLGMGALGGAVGNIGGMPFQSSSGIGASLLKPGSVPGFATGGSFTVGGSGGTDKTPVSFLATKGERVTVETPAQQRQGGQTIINNNTTVINYSPRVTPSSYTSRRSSREGFEMLLAMAR